MMALFKWGFKDLFESEIDNEIRCLKLISSRLIVLVFAQVYKIDVMTKSSHWFVLRRYREFHDLHKKVK